MEYRPRKAEIQEARLSESINEYVARLEVAMYHSLLMCVGYGAYDFQHERNGISHIASSADCVQCHTVHMFHHNTWRIGGFYQCVYRDDIRMSETSSKTRFTSQELNPVLRLKCDQDRFDSNDAVELRIPGLVDHAHPTMTELTYYLIAVYLRLIRGSGMAVACYPR